MASKWIHFVLFAVLFYISGATEKDDTGNANDYVDTVLDNLRKDPEIAKYLDPLRVPDLHESSFSLKNTRVIGLSKLKRHGDCTRSYNGKTMNVVAQVAVSNAKVLFDYGAKPLFFWVNGEGEVAVDHLAVKLDLSSTDGNARVNSIKVVNLGNYYVKSLSGRSIIKWLVKIIANKAGQGSRQIIIDALENGAKDALNNILQQYKLPIY